MHPDIPTEGQTLAQFARGVDHRTLRAQVGICTAERRVAAAASALCRILGAEVPDELTTRPYLDALIYTARTAPVPYAKRRLIASAVAELVSERVRMNTHREHLARLKEIHAAHGGWWRFYQDPSGQLHLSTGCAALVLSTIGKTPQLVPALSGAEPGAIAAAVESSTQLCGMCFQHKRIEREREIQFAAHHRLLAG